MDIELNSFERDSPDAWLARNLLNNGALPSGPTAKDEDSNFRLRVLPALLLISAVVVVAMWYQEEHLDLISTIDRIAYPLLLAVTTVGALLLKRRPASLRVVSVVVYLTFVTHILAAYFLEMGQRLYGGGGTSYEITILVLWLPLGYVGGFVFFPLRKAVRAALVFYAAVAFPQFMLLGIETDPVARQLAVAILISQPVYIAALWGVGLLKREARGTQDLVKNMSREVHVDPLTGVANRRAMSRVLEAVIRSQGGSERPVALLLFDVDHFKRINDRFGHEVGDEVLIRMAHQAQGQQRSSDLLGRWGGEEFMILLLDEKAEQALQVAERLRAGLERIAHPQVGRVTVSVGVTALLPGEDVHQFIQRADVALYRAKEQGRNRVEGQFS